MSRYSCVCSCDGQTDGQQADPGRQPCSRLRGIFTHFRDSFRGPPRKFHPRWLSVSSPHYGLRRCAPALLCSIDNEVVNYPEKRILAWRSLLAVFLVLTGCATRSAPDFDGRWKPVNRYAESADEIPLHQPYVFHASPLDGTLKNLLDRWAKDSKMTLSYLHPSDFRLHAPASSIRTQDLQQAVSELTMAYANQHVSVTASNNQIVVRRAPIDVDEPATAP